MLVANYLICKKRIAIKNVFLSQSVKLIELMAQLCFPHHRRMKWTEELGFGQKNIRKYTSLYFENSEIEIHRGEEFVFSITYRDPKEFEFAENIPISH